MDSHVNNSTGVQRVNTVNPDHVNIMMNDLKGMSSKRRIELYSRIAHFLTRGLWFNSESDTYKNIVTGIEHVERQLIEQMPKKYLNEFNRIFITLGQCQFASALYDRIEPLLMTTLQDRNMDKSRRKQAATGLLLGRMAHRSNGRMGHHNPNSLRPFNLLFAIGFNCRHDLNSLQDHCNRLLAAYIAQLGDDELAQAMKEKLQTIAGHVDTTANGPKTGCLVVALERFPSETMTYDSEWMRDLVAKAKYFSNVGKYMKYYTKKVHIEAVHRFEKEEIRVDSIPKRVIYKLCKSVLGSSQLAEHIATSPLIREHLEPQPKTPRLEVVMNCLKSVVPASQFGFRSL